MAEQIVKEEVETTETVTDTATVETQQAITQEPAADTTEIVIPKTESIGITKEEGKVEGGDSQADFNSNLNDLVAKALSEDGLSEEERKGILDAGMADNFNMIIEGHQSRQAATDKEIQSAAGGEKEYAELIEFAKSNFNDSEVEAFNHAVLESGNVGVAKLAVEGLKARYVAQHGSEPSKVIQAGGTANVSSQGFESPLDYINETRTLEYLNDPEHRQKVEARRAASGF